MFSSMSTASPPARQRPTSLLRPSLHDGPTQRRIPNLALTVASCLLAAVALATLTVPLSFNQGSRATWHPAAALIRNAKGGHVRSRGIQVGESTALKGGARPRRDHDDVQTQRKPHSRILGGEPEVWARDPAHNSTTAVVALRVALGNDTVRDLRALCGRCLYRTLTSYVWAHDHGRFTVVLTGDIAAMWLRDSAVQMATYLPRVTKRPALRPLVEGAIRAHAYFILQDPWANAYNAKYVPPESLPKYDRQLGRGGWVFTRNFELDSVAYFFTFLWNYHQTPGIWSSGTLVAEPMIHDAVVQLIKLLVMEQHHETRSPYRYSELAREGLGPPAAYTGMVWSAFRPSDDPQKYSYNVPDNMYLWGALQRLILLNDAVWQDEYIQNTAAQLMEDLRRGIEQHAVVEVEPGVRVYAYEVDGLGGVVADFDDPNLPSLLAIPLLGYELYDAQIYAATRARILSHQNPYYFEGTELRGLGSPHTAHNYVWPLATAVEALTMEGQGSAAQTRQAKLLRDLLKMASSGNGLAHESVNVDNLEMITRPEFGWANAMTVVAVEQLLGVDCDEAAEDYRLSKVWAREQHEVQSPANGGRDLASYYEQLEASVSHR